MKRVLFVLQEGKVGCWEVCRGVLVRRTLKGDRWHPFTAAFWDDWKSAHQIGDDDEVDTLFLSDQAGAFGRLPGFLKIEGLTSWTVELLSSVAKDPDFSKASIYILQSIGKSLLIGALDPVREVSLVLLPASDFSLPEGENDRRFRAVFNVLDGNVFEQYQHGVIAAARMATCADDVLKFETDEWIHLATAFRCFGFSLVEWLCIVENSFKNAWNTEEFVGQCCAYLRDERLQRLFLADCTRTYIECGGDPLAWLDSLERILDQVGESAKGWLEWLRVVTDVARGRQCDPGQENSLRVLFEPYEVKYLIGDYLRDAEIVKRRQTASADERKAIFRCIVLDALVRGKEVGFVDVGRRLVRCSVPTYGSQRYLFSDDCICGLGVDGTGSVTYIGPSCVGRSDWSLEKVLKCLRAYYDQLELTGDFTQAVCEIMIDGMQSFLPQLDRQVEDATPEEDDWLRVGWKTCNLNNYKGAIAEFNDMFEAARNCLNLAEGVSLCSSPCLVVELDRQGNNDAVVKFLAPQWKDLYSVEKEEWQDLTGEPYALISSDIVAHSNVVTWDKSCVEEDQAKKVASAFFHEIPKWLIGELRQTILNSTQNQ
ncbi:MAG: hypothetical protein ACI4UY_01555 [Kiritimatiellia bacterium]